MTQINEMRLTSQTTGLRRTKVMLAAVLAVPLLAGLPARVAHAQFQANNGNGHALDANNQVGSGGYNRGSGNGPGVTNSNIIYGNLTGLGAFSGPLQSTDPTAFRGTTFTYSADRFIGISNPAPVRGTPSASTNSYTTTPYYSEARGVAPPAGYVPVVGGGGYVPPNSSQSSVYAYQLPSSTLSSSVQTGAGFFGNGSVDTNLNPSEGVNGPYTPYGTNLRLGPTDMSNDQSLLYVSPLSGVQQGQVSNNPADTYNLPRGELLRLQGSGRFPRIDNQTLDQMRREAQQTPDQQGQPQQQNPDELNNKVLQPLESPINKPLDATIGSKLSVAQPLNNAIGTQEGQYRALSSAAQQTPVLSELDRRLAQFKQRAPLAEEQEASYEAAVAKAGAEKGPAKAPANPAAVAPGLPGGPNRVVPGGPTVPLIPARPAKPDIGALAGGTKTEPVHIGSLSDGVRAKGLAGLLKAAEDLMKQGKFTSAIDQYSLAEQVAPNNPLIPLGEANAELGAASYRDAEQHLRQAFASDEALLHAQFDLNSVIGQQRVRTLMDDLKGLAAQDPKAEMPVFLLAYLNYNTGHEAEAMTYLDDVLKREGHPDPVVARMRLHWYVPATKPAGPQLNK